MTTPATELRDRIRRAICEASGFTWLPDELMEPDEYGEHADAVLAVLPAPAPAAPADRATVLREAADFFDGCLRNAADPDSDPRYWAAIRDVAMGLRRVADEAQPTATEAHPSNSSWLVEWREEGGNWAVVYPTHDRSKALDRLSRGRKESLARQWRLVRETCVYTVEPTEPATAATEEPQP